MAVCGECGTKDNKIDSDYNGNCGKCHDDFWVEWEDFLNSSLQDYIKLAASKLKITKWELAKEVIDSEKMVSYRQAIEDIFTKT